MSLSNLLYDDTVHMGAKQIENHSATY